MIPFGEYLPDQPQFNNPGVTKALNVYPSEIGYRPFPAFSPYSDAANGRVMGAVFLKDSESNTFGYAGTATKLYQLSSTLIDVSGTTYSSFTTAWEFAYFNGEVIATNYYNSVQTATPGDAAFANLAGSPPKAQRVAVVGNFVVLGDIDDASDGQVPNRVHWCAFDDETGWTPGTNQSDYQNLKGSSKVQKIIGGDYGVVFMDRAIWRMDYAGTPTIFEFTNVQPERGTPAPGSVVQYGRYIYYMSSDGFYRLVDGAYSEPIGAGKVDKTIIDQIEATNLSRVTATIDPKRKLYICFFPGTGSSSGNPNMAALYHWPTGKWSIIEEDVNLVFYGGTFTLTLEELDAYGDLDSLPYSLDSPAWQGGADILSGFDQDHKFGYFNGSDLTAQIETSEIGGDNIVGETYVRPYVEGSGTVTVQIGTRTTLAGAVSYNAATSLDDTGKADVIVNARYARARINISGGFTLATGVDSDLFDSGKR
jgi:hypothetical protein